MVVHPERVRHPFGALLLLQSLMLLKEAVAVAWSVPAWFTKL